MSTAEVVQYLQWKKDVAKHDYAAASSYLSIRLSHRPARYWSSPSSRRPRPNSNN